MSQARVFALAAGIQSYDWGKIGSSSKAAQYAQSAAQPSFTIDENKPYAEVRSASPRHSNTDLPIVASYGWERIRRCHLKFI